MRRVVALLIVITVLSVPVLSAQTLDDALTAVNEESTWAVVGFVGGIAGGIGALLLTMWSFMSEPEQPLLGTVSVLGATGLSLLAINSSGQILVHEQRRTALSNFGSTFNEQELTAIMDQSVFVGMREQAAVAAWGSPSDVNRTITAKGTSAQWVYRVGDLGARYVYVENGIVTGIQD